MKENQMLTRLYALLLVSVIWLGIACSAQAAIAFRAAAQARALSQVGVVPAFITSATDTMGASPTNTISVNRPGTVVAGRVLVAQLTLRGIIPSVTPPAGWTLVDITSTSTSGAEVTQAVFWHVETATEPATYTWTWGASTRANVGIAAFDNVEPTNPIDVWGVQSANSNATITLPNLTTTSVNTILVALMSSVKASSHSTPTGMNEYYDLSSLGGPNGVTTSAATLVRASPGATGARTATISGGASDNIAHMIALRPNGALTIDVPTGTVLNDVMIATVAYRPCSGSSGGACTTTITPPAGWMLVRTVDTTTGAGTDGYGSRLFVYMRVASATEPVNYTWYFGGALPQAGAVGGIMSFSGVDTASPLVVENGQSTPSSRNHTAPSINTGTVTNTMLVSSHSLNSSGTWTPPAGMTEAVDINSRGAINDLGMSLEMNYQAQAAAGATGTRTATLSNPPSGDTGGTHMLALRPASGGLDHIRFEHDGSAVTCAAETITIKACADAACTTLYSSGSTTVTMSGTGWSGNPLTFTGSAIVNLSKTSPQTVTLATTAVAPVPPNGVDCFNGTTTNNTTACQLPFADTGFIFSSIPTQVAGVTSDNITLQAVKTTGAGVCTGVFTGKIAIDMASQCVNPTTCAGKQIIINGTAIENNSASGISSYTSVTLDFGTDSTAIFTLSYPDVGMMNLHGRKMLADPDYMTGSSNAFVVKPDHFVLSAIQQTAAPNTANPAAVDAAGAKFIKAGEEFSVTVAAMTAGGAATPNYGQEVTPEGVKLTSALVGGLGLTNNPALSNSSAFGAFAAGAATGTTFSWEEAGIITLTPSVADGDYLGAGNVSGTTSGNVGRFYPNNFAMTGASLTNRSDLPACVAPTFSYMDEPFQVNFTLTAQGVSGATLQNYAGSFAKLVLTTPVSFGFGAVNSSTDLTTRLDLSTASSGTWGTPSAGNAAVTATLAIKRISPLDGPFSLLDIGIAPKDTDNVALLPGALNLNVAGAGNDHAELAQTDVRFGRLRLYNAHGSELLALPVPLRAQFYNGSGFITNTLDNCTQVTVPTSANGGLVFPAGQTLVAGDTTASINGATSGSGTFASGDGGMMLTRPLSAHFGYVNLTIVAPAYLQYNWNNVPTGGNLFDDNPQARATFGKFRNANEFIYLRENY